MKTTLTIFFCLVFAFTSFAQSETIAELKESKELIRNSYHFYPSTMRMININRDENFDKLVKPIRKLSFYTMNESNFTQSDLQLAATQLKSDEAYESFLDISGPDTEVHILGRPSQENICVLAYADSSIYISEVQGKIDFLKLVDVYESIQNQDSTGIGQFVDLFGIIKQNDDNSREREERNREWDRIQAEKDSIAAMKADSLKRVKESVQQE